MYPQDLQQHYRLKGVSFFRHLVHVRRQSGTNAYRRAMRLYSKYFLNTTEITAQ